MIFFNNVDASPPPLNIPVVYGRLWVLNNEKMISVFILNSFVEYKKEIKPDYIF